jgi:tetratricopeptide (TPR) repeat protein
MDGKDSPQTATSGWKKIASVFLGLVLSLALLEVGLRLGGFVLSSMQEYGNLQSIKQKGTYRILCLGESTTQRQYPQYLEQVLNQRNIGVRFSVIDRGKAGTNTPAILSRVESYLAEYHPDMVVAMMGNNDQGIKYYQDISESLTWIFQHCRVYRFGRILCMQLLKKFQKKDIYDSDRADFERKPRADDQGTAMAKSGPKNDQVDLEFKKAIELDPKNDKVYVERGRLYRDQGKFQQAVDCYRKATEINPKNDEAWIELGQLYYRFGAWRLTRDSLRKAIEINPKNEMAYFELGRLCQRQGESRQAEDLFKRAIELNPENSLAFYQLGILYRDQGKLSQAEDSFRRSDEIRPQDERTLGAIASLYEEMGKPELAKEYTAKAEKLRLGDKTGVTAHNYHKLKDVLDRNRIRLVCVQYPVRNVDPLMNIFAKDEGVIFVDNEMVFKEAVKRSGYKEYFRDMFAGDFGHCTQKGNELLAQNIANVILREVFNK